MIVYKLVYQHNEQGCVLDYHASRSDAVRAFKIVQRSLAAGESVDLVGIYRHDIPRTRKGVLDFLNQCTPVHDNG